MPLIIVHLNLHRNIKLLKNRSFGVFDRVLLAAKLKHPCVSADCSSTRMKIHLKGMFAYLASTALEGITHAKMVSNAALKFDLHQKYVALQCD